MDEREPREKRVRAHLARGVGGAQRRKTKGKRAFRRDWCEREEEDEEEVVMVVEEEEEEDGRGGVGGGVRRAARRRETRARPSAAGRAEQVGSCPRNGG